jgi:delta14-sterol reductase
MLVWGDLVFIPFTFSIQAWFLLNDRAVFSPIKFAAYCLLFAAGYSVFRFANKQKHDFKKNPNGLVWGRPPKVLGGRCA